MGKYRKILVAFDGSESSKNALLQSFRLAKDEKSWLTVTSVIPPYTGELDLTGVKDIKRALSKPCEDALSMAEDMAKTNGALIKTVWEEGEIYERIVDLADSENCDLIVMGRKGLRGIERVFVGSVTARVIGHTQRDVLVVPENTTIGWGKILLATDGSRYSDGATEKAINFVKSYGGSLSVISVVDIPVEYYAEAQKAYEKLIEKAKEFITSAKEKATASGIEARGIVGEGVAHEVITQTANKEKADVIFIGSHGRTGLKRLLMGSVTERVIGYAPCPVLIIKS